MPQSNWRLHSRCGIEKVELSQVLSETLQLLRARFSNRRGKRLQTTRYIGHGNRRTLEPPTMKPLKIAEVRQHTGRRMTVDEAATFVSPGQARSITRNQACAVEGIR